jgi:hypothetical protein
MNANYKKTVPLSVIFIYAICASVLCTMAACGNSENQTTQQPLVTTVAQGEAANAKIAIAAGGTSGSYTPHYEGEQLVEIREERLGTNGTVQGRYQFQGARLMRYEGAGFEDDHLLSVEFNLEGRLVAARKGNGQATEEEIVQVRRRAQLLRSHALAQHASKMHTANH